MYIIGVYFQGTKKCREDIEGRTKSEPIHSYIGWILKRVYGQVCGTEDKINDWFDQAGEQDDM